MKNIALILIISITGYMMSSCVNKHGKIPPGQLKKHTGLHPSHTNPGKGNKKK